MKINKKSVQLVLTPLIDKQLFLFSLDVVYIFYSLKPCVSMAFKKHMGKNKHGKKLLTIVSLNEADRRGWEWMGEGGSAWEWVGIAGSKV